MKKGLFITGADTDAGKTLVSAWIRYHTGYGYWKPIQSGASTDSDTDFVSSLASLPAPGVQEREKIYLPTYVFQAYASPEFAAQQEEREVFLEELHWPANGPLLVEGAGGILVPLSHHLTVLDLIKFLDIPVLVVARNKLGAINHTCLTLEALRSANVEVKGVVLSGNSDLENEKAIERLSGVPVRQILPDFSRLDDIYRHPMSESMQEIFQ